MGTFRRAIACHPIASLLMLRQSLLKMNSPTMVGMRQALPLVAGYVPIAISFGLIAVQAGFSPLEAVIISTFIYAGGSQFLFVGMVAAGAPLGLVVALSLLINARHVVYGPNIAPWLTVSRWWPFLAHGLTDQVFAVAHNRLPEMQEQERVGWFAGIMLPAWISWIGGTAIGALSGEELISQWPLLGDSAAFALPALFLVLLAPQVKSYLWLLTVMATTMTAAILAFAGFTNIAVPLSAMLGALCFYTMKDKLNRE